MAGSEVILLLSLSAILALLKLVQRPSDDAQPGADAHKGPVRVRPKSTYSSNG